MDVTKSTPAEGKHGKADHGHGGSSARVGSASKTRGESKTTKASSKVCSFLLLSMPLSLCVYLFALN